MTSPELGSGEREEAGIGANQRDAHPELKSGVGEAEGSEVMANFTPESMAAGGVLMTMASPVGGYTSNWSCRSKKSSQGSPLDNTAARGRHGGHAGAQRRPAASYG